MLSFLNTTPRPIHINAEEGRAVTSEVVEEQDNGVLKVTLKDNEELKDILEKNGLTLPTPENTPNAVVHEPAYPKEYKNGQPTKKFPEEGIDKGFEPNSLTISNFHFDFTDFRGNTGSQEDYTELVEVIDQNKVVSVGMNGMSAFLGHYYDLTGNGVFNPIVDEDLIYEGAEVVVTDENGKSKGYEITSISEFLNDEQHNHFYGNDSFPYLAYYGNGDDMVYIQYCRWDISLGLLISSVGYRVW